MIAPGTGLLLTAAGLIGAGVLLLAAAVRDAGASRSSEPVDPQH